MKTIKTMSIGDIHGRNDWMYFTHGSPEDFENWKNSGTTWEVEFAPYLDYDKIVFVGDYVDSFTITNIEMKKNLEDIIFFKKAFPDKVVLLLGNHDVQYIIPDHYCSGFRGEMKNDFYQLFHENLNSFAFAYQLGNTLWTHAGVTNQWFAEFESEMFKDDSRFKAITQKYIKATVAEKLNVAWGINLDCLYNVDETSGGWKKWAGPIWVRPHILNKHSLDGFYQIVGHTPQAAIWVTDNVAYIDCLEHNSDRGDVYYLDVVISE